MTRQALVLGLGQFGTALARSLTERGVEVIAVDRSQARVQAISSSVAQSLCFDATDEHALRRVDPAARDVCVCSIGDESKEGAIICTALLRQMGAKQVVARASNEVTERILRLVGAHRVVNPEQAFGERFANQLTYHGLLDEVPLGEDLVISEIEVPKMYTERNVRDLELPRKFGVTLVAIRRKEGDQVRVFLPKPDDMLREGDAAVVVSSPAAVRQLAERA